jgi:hypothetical protein
MVEEALTVSWAVRHRSHIVRRNLRYLNPYRIKVRLMLKCDLLIFNVHFRPTDYLEFEFWNG